MVKVIAAGTSMALAKEMTEKQIKKENVIYILYVEDQYILFYENNN